MPIKLYMDVQVPYAITKGLRSRNVDVVTSQEDQTRTLADPKLLDRAAALGRSLFTYDSDLLIEATRRQRNGQLFAGVIYAHQENVTTSECIDELELIAGVYDPEDMANRIEYLPVK